MESFALANKVTNANHHDHFSQGLFDAIRHINGHAITRTTRWEEKQQWWIIIACCQIWGQDIILFIMPTRGEFCWPDSGKCARIPHFPHPIYQQGQTLKGADWCQLLEPGNLSQPLAILEMDVALQVCLLGEWAGGGEMGVTLTFVFTSHSTFNTLQLRARLQLIS